MNGRAKQGRGGAARVRVLSAEGTERNGRHVPAVRRAVCSRAAGRATTGKAAAAGQVQVAPRLPLDRRSTEGMLRRYLRMSMECGRVPSLLGREMFRGGRVTSYKIRSFDDVVIFVHDVESCLRRLLPEEWRLLERIALQEYTQGEAAALLGMSLRTVVRRYGAAVDRLSGIFLEAGLMEAIWDGAARDAAAWDGLEEASAAVMGAEGAVSSSRSRERGCKSLTRRLVAGEELMA